MSQVNGRQSVTSRHSQKEMTGKLREDEPVTANVPKGTKALADHLRSLGDSEGHRMDAKTLRYHLREACKQIDEFRKRCDPDERQVLVTPTEMLGADSFSEEARWYDV